MKRVLRIFLRGLIVVIVLAIALFGYFVYSPSPEAPRLSGKLTEGTVQVGALKRTYMTYVPKGLAKGAPLVVVLHGSDQDGAQIRRWTGYGFDRLADEHGFAVAYPNGYEGYWNAWNIVGDYSANKLNIDDLGFLTATVEKLVNELGIDPGRVFATGVSRGGHMAFRLALEAPSRFRAVAAVAANLPTPETFKCKPAEQGTSSVMIMNGVKDPLNPFEGGEVKFFGLIRRGRVRSSRESGQYFATPYHIPSAPQKESTQPTDAADVTLWQNDPKVQVELVAIRGGGHVMPQPYRLFRNGIRGNPLAASFASHFDVERCPPSRLRGSQRVAPQQRRFAGGDLASLTTKPRHNSRNGTCPQSGCSGFRNRSTAR